MPRRRFRPDNFTLALPGTVVLASLLLSLPFTLGHLARRWIGGFVNRCKPLLGFTDQGTILLVVYTAFNAAAMAGLWRAAMHSGARRLRRRMSARRIEPPLASVELPA